MDNGVADTQLGSQTGREFQYLDHENCWKQQSNTTAARMQFYVLVTVDLSLILIRSIDLGSMKTRTHIRTSETQYVGNRNISGAWRCICSMEYSKVTEQLVAPGGCLLPGMRCSRQMEAVKRQAVIVPEIRASM